MEEMDTNAEPLREQEQQQNGDQQNQERGQAGQEQNAGNEALPDTGAERDGQNEEGGFGGAAPSGTSPCTAGTESADEDAANPDLAERDTSKGFDRDQEELDTGLDDGDLDNDVPTDTDR